jgi:nicotinate-nucleotide pyrophosphorylase (carboxylating)
MTARFEEIYVGGLRVLRGQFSSGGALTEEKLMEFLKEDIGYGDITSNAIIDEDARAQARLYFREEGVAAGLEVASAILNLFGCSVDPYAADGQLVPPEKTLLEAEGPARALLAVERTILNLVGRMAGISSTVAETVAKAKRVNPEIRVAATRKTAPGLRDFDKRAVELGGGDTHRFRLDDCVLIKDNHLNFGLTMTEAIQRVKEGVSFTKKVEVEVTSLIEAEEAAEAGADIIMFDNMPPEEIQECLSTLSEKGLREGRLYEASGGITAGKVEDYAASGVDIISMGSLTHTVRNVNVKLEIEGT